MDWRIQRRLQQVSSRVRLLRLAWRLNATWLILALIGVLFLVVNRQQLWSTGPGVGLSLLITGLLLAGWFALLSMMQRSDLRAIAQLIEERYPVLKQRLLAAIDQRPSGSDGSYGYLQKSLLEDTLNHDERYQWSEAIPAAKVKWAWLLNLPALLVLLAVAGSLTTLGRQSAEQSPAAAAAAAGKSAMIAPVIEPGDTEVELGASLIVTAKFPGQVPTQVNLQRLGDSQAGQLPMRRSLDDPLYAAYVTDIRQPLSYRIEYDQQQSKAYQVKVFQYPALVRSDAQLVFPTYAQMEDKTIVNTRRVSAVIGSDLTWECHLNKAIPSATLIDEDGFETSLVADPTHPQLMRAKFKVTQSRTWQLKLVDDAQRANKVEIKLSLKALPNTEPKLKLATGDVRVSPLEEFTIAAKASDDFGLERMGVSYQFAGEEPVEVELPVPTKGAPAEGNNSSASEATGKELANMPTRSSKNAELSQLVAMESLNAQPDQLLSYYAWVEDRDENNEVRRVTSDMFFAEVRPFEEIYRQGEQPSEEQQRQQQQQQGQQGQGSQSEEILELQKQIVTGTWNVRRTASKTQLPTKASEDLNVLAEAQGDVAQALAEKSAEINAPGGEQLIQLATEHMQTAQSQLTAAAASRSLSDVSKALSTAQLAYQDLLKLQAKEFEVSRSQQQSGQQQQSSRQRQRQQQLDQLRLENRDNRYENERTAQEEQAEENSQLRQIQSRLRELAARQEDLNEQIRELQAALQAADTEQERQEIEKRLERLRQQQQQMLDDADELREQLEGQQSNEALAQAQEQMEQTRENLRQSSEALNQGNTSQALASGTRAEQELKELQDKVRQESANQFSDAMRQMQSDATELENAQNQLAERLKTTQEDTSTGLRSNISNDDVTQQVAEQQSRLEKLMQEMRSTVEAAEESEPLLAQRLYDTYRTTEQKQTDTDLDTTRQLVQRGLNADAQQLVEKTSQDLSQLRQGIDKAAEAVLGSEVDSLRLALDQLQQLSRQIDQELVQNQPTTSPSRNDQQLDNSQSSSNPQASDQQATDQQATDQQATDQQRSGQRQNTQQQAGQSEAGQKPTGQQQSGQQQSGQQQDGQQQSGQQSDGQQEPNGQQPDGQQQSDQQQGGQQQGGQQQSGQQQGGQQQGGGRQQSGQRPAGLRDNQAASDQAGMRRGSENQASDGAYRGEGWIDQFDGNRWDGPITGEGFRDFSDRLREVEELVGDPELRSRATQIRQAARELRTEVKKHAAEPKWDLVKQLVADPLRDLSKQVSQELLRKVGDKNSLVPIDRDPVPGRFNESVRRYYENLGSGR